MSSYSHSAPVQYESQSDPVYYGSPTTSGENYDSEPTPAGGSDAAADDSQTSVSSDSVLISVSVPADAKVYINGYETKSVGTTRTYVSRGLAAGQRYKYEVRAEVQRDGQTSTDTKVAFVTPSQTSRLAFNLPPVEAAPSVVSQPDASDEAPKTTLRLHVPSDAEVSIAGSATKSTGPVREFSTRRLAEGEKWDDYVIRAEVKREGRSLVRQLSISLSSGESRDLTIDFDTADVASVAAARQR